MIRDVIMPQLAMGMSEGTIVEWGAAEGERVARDARLLAIETEKVITDIPAPYAGWVHLLAMTPWAISMREFQSLPPRHRRSFYAGAGLTCMAVALPGTWLGYQLSGLLPAPVTLALVFLNPLFFLLSFLEVRSRANRLAIALGGLLAPAFFLWHPPSSLVTTGLVAGTLAYWIDREWRARRGRTPS